MSTLKALKEGFFQKGWAGKTISREETAARLDPILRAHIRLNRMYDAASLDMQADTTELDRAQKLARGLVGKIAETIYSCGGVAYQGTDLEPGDFRSRDSDDVILNRLLALEDDLENLIDGEEDIEHQMRTRAIFDNLRKAAADRRKNLRAIGKTVNAHF